MLARIGIIFVINVLLYHRTLRYSYVSDDIPIFHHPPKFKNKWHKIFLWITGSYKWSPKKDHIANLLIHAAVSIMIYLAFGATNVSFLAGILFAINPANNQGSMWISGRGYTLPLLCLLSAMCVPHIVAIPLLYCCTWYTVGFLIPLVLLGSSHWVLIIIMPIIWWLHSKKFVGAVKIKTKMETVPEDHRMHIGKLVMAIKTVGFYLSLCFFPAKITFYHSFLQSCAGNTIMRKRAYTVKDIFFWVGLASIVGWGAYIYFNGWNMVSYGMMWYFVTIAPFSNLKRVQQEITERYAYIPCVGVMLALATLIVSYPILIAIFITGYAVKLTHIMRMYVDDYWLVESAVYEDPGAWYAWHTRGHKRWSNGSHKEALTMWVMAKLISPKEFKVLFNIACVLKLLKKYQESKQYLKEAEENIIEGQEELAKNVFKELANGKTPLLR